MSTQTEERPVLLVAAGAPDRGDKTAAADWRLITAGLAWAEGHTGPRCGGLRYDPQTGTLADPCGRLAFQVAAPAHDRTAAA